eukprot:2426660-Prymnesium_polylepis.1
MLCPRPMGVSALIAITPVCIDEPMGRRPAAGTDSPKTATAPSEEPCATSASGQWRARSLFHVPDSICSPSEPFCIREKPEKAS